MSIDTAKLIYFSPTETTRKILDGIAQGVQAASIERLNLTLPDAATRNFSGARADLAIIGMPVYAGRLPQDAVNRLKRINGNGAPAVVVVLYGNRAYDDALIELRDVATEAGFVPIAAGAFIGEHSFSTDNALIAHQRPDGSDLQCAQEFGQAVRPLLASLAVAGKPPALQVPGNVPYMDYKVLQNVAPASDDQLCTRCGACATACPTGAIALQGNIMATDASLCILCCACVKQCTIGARELNDERINKLRGMLTTKFAQRKEPELFYCATGSTG